MSEGITSQLSLGIGLDDDARFENFLISSANQQAIAYLQSEAPEQFIFLWGNGSPGLTHLLQAACHQASVNEMNAIYLPLKDRANFPPEILQGANSLSLVCIDDVQEIAGDDEWEAALFTAFNNINDSDTQLIISADRTPQSLDCTLADLQSRLQSGLILKLSSLRDEEKILALQLRASQRGMELSDPVAEYILLRADRSLVALMNILDELDRSSLEQKRKLTVPLVKSTLGW